MIFTIAVLGGPQDSQANLHALKFARSVIDTGHKINRIFFYHEGVSVALKAIELASDEFNYGDAWADFSEETKTELAVCVASGNRRGVLDNQTESSKTTLARGFELVGLGQLVEAISTSDRYIEFALRKAFFIS